MSGLSSSSHSLLGFLGLSWLSLFPRSGEIILGTLQQNLSQLPIPVSSLALGLRGVFNLVGILFSAPTAAETSRGL